MRHSSSTNDALDTTATITTITLKASSTNPAGYVPDDNADHQHGVQDYPATS
jgi:hypothetical protein